VPKAIPVRQAHAIIGFKALPRKRRNKYFVAALPLATLKKVFAQHLKLISRRASAWRRHLREEKKKRKKGSRRHGAESVADAISELGKTSQQESNQNRSKP